MNIFWYVVQNNSNKERIEYLIGYLYGRSDATEEELIEYVLSYCKEKNYRLALLFQYAPLLMMVNQIYPYDITNETSVCLKYAMETIEQQEIYR